MNASGRHLDVVDLFVLSVRIWIVVPVFVAVGLAVFEPEYWQPMHSTVLGWVLLFVAVNVVGISIGLTELGRRMMRRGGGWLAAGLMMLVATFLVQFIAIWLVMLGPAVIILLRPTKGS
jgi:hypothetical protein